VVPIRARVGITPVLAMLHALAAARSTREVWWLHGARNGAEHAFAGECDELLRQLPRGCRYVVYSQPLASDSAGRGFDARGHLNLALLTRIGVARDADFYCCGPAAFLESMTRDLPTLGVARDRLHSETFGPGTFSTPGMKEHRPPPHPPPGPDGAGPRVSFARSGLSVHWDPRYQTLLDLAEACDVPVHWSCRTGVCHTCEAGLIGGSVAYDAEPLDAPAKGNLLLCCSRPRDDVQIDL
jgi:ferredoxin-NADP reductase